MKILFGKQFYHNTDRVYSSNPSLSQIPKILRYSIVPHEGNKFLYADLKAAEVYILVKWAKCESLIDAYESGEDLYTYIAQKVMGKETIGKETVIDKQKEKIQERTSQEYIEEKESATVKK